MKRLLLAAVLVPTLCLAVSSTVAASKPSQTKVLADALVKAP